MVTLKQLKGWHKKSLTSQQRFSEELSKRVEEGMIYLGLPSYSEIKDRGAKKNSLWSHIQHGSQEDVNFFIRNHMLDLADHTSRVTLDAISIGDFLGMNTPKYQEMFESFVYSAGTHDRGKLRPELRDINEKKTNFTLDDMEKMRNHLGWFIGGNMLTNSITALHHSWQKNGYSVDEEWFRRGMLQRTPEAEVLSKLLAVDDFHDAVSTRTNTRNYAVPRLPTKEEAKQLLISEYGQLPIVYQGEKLPKLDMSGEELICSFYKEGIFGRKNPINPYPRPYSFIKRPTFMQTFLARRKTKQREKEIYCG